MKVILLSIIACLFVSSAAAAGRSPLCCSICGAPHGNLIGNGICLDCNKREFDIRPNGGGSIAIRPRVRR